MTLPVCGREKVNTEEREKLRASKYGLYDASQKFRNVCEGVGLFENTLKRLIMFCWRREGVKEECVVVADALGVGASSFRFLDCLCFVFFGIKGRGNFYMISIL